jgi:hypothetical protein
MKFINKEELLEALERRYEDLEDDSGCSIRTNDGYEWLSIARIVAIINTCDEYSE